MYPAPLRMVAMGQAKSRIFQHALFKAMYICFGPIKRSCQLFMFLLQVLMSFNTAVRRFTLLCSVRLGTILARNLIVLILPFLPIMCVHASSASIQSVWYLTLSTFPSDTHRLILHKPSKAGDSWKIQLPKVIEWRHHRKFSQF